MSSSQRTREELLKALWAIALAQDVSPHASADDAVRMHSEHVVPRWIQVDPVCERPISQCGAIESWLTLSLEHQRTS